DVTATGCQIYGNIFYHSLTGTGRNAVIALGNLGENGTAVDCLVYNNTFAIADTSVFVAVRLSSGSGNIARNNLFTHNSGNTPISANTASDNDVAASSALFVDLDGLDFRIASA